MPVPRAAYFTTTWQYLPEAYCLDERALFRDIDAAMNNLQGEILRTALRHLYIKWGDYCDEGREEFATDMMALAETRNMPAVRKPVRRRSQSLAGPAESGLQAVLF